MFGILVCGDSIAFGSGESPHVGWAGRLKNEFEPKDEFNDLFNLSIPGETSTGLLERFGTELGARIRYRRPEDRFVVMIAVGINDAKGRGTPDAVETPKEQFRENVTELARIAKRYTDSLVVVGLTPVDERLTNPFEDTYMSNAWIQEYDKVLEQIACEKGAHYLHLFGPFSRLDYIEMLADGVHPNRTGYEALYGLVRDFLVKEGLMDKRAEGTS